MPSTRSSRRPQPPRPLALVLVPVLLAAGVAAGCAPEPAPEAPVMTLPGQEAGWALVWRQEFDGPQGTQPSREDWNYDVGNRDTNGWGNLELQYYTDSPENVSTDGRGNLAITARRAPPGADLPCWDGGNCAYTSARLTTKDLFAVDHGRVDARIRVPAGRGLWPAFWALGAAGRVWPNNGEIDIMEWIGRTPRTVYGTLHGPGYSGAPGTEGHHTLDQPYSDAFHLFTIVKRPGDIRWFVDGEQYHRVTPGTLPEGSEWVFDEPFYLLLNLALGGNWPGPPDDSTRFPATLLVDYVRVYGPPG
jgi:beta-glucanase (GH16 family)